MSQQATPTPFPPVKLNPAHNLTKEARSRGGKKSSLRPRGPGGTFLPKEVKPK